MVLHHIIQTLFLISGVVMLIAAIRDWDWFFTSKNAEPVVSYFGRKKSRWVYGVLGLILISIAIGFYFHVT